MPRELGDVLHYFIPGLEQAGGEAETRSVGSAGEAPEVDEVEEVDEAEGVGRASGESDAWARRSAQPRGSLARRDHSIEASPAIDGRAVALPVVGVVLGDGDVVRAAFTWNLCVEIARLGASATLVTPACDAQSPLWPETGRGPLGSEVVVSDARGLGELHRAAMDVAVERAAEASEGGAVLVRIPPAWLRKAADAGPLLRWTLLFTSSDPADLLETYGIAKLLLAADPRARVGVTIHGVRRVREAERAFHRLSGSAERHLELRLWSYGLLVDDLHVYRAIVARRAIGLEHPQSPAAKALRDVARMLLDDARERVLG